MATTPLKPYRRYLGQMFFDHMGQFIHEVGGDNDKAADAIKQATKALDGKWAFGVRKQMIQTKVGEPEQWESFLVFVDGKQRKLRPGEYAPEKGVVRMQWIPFESVRSILDSRPGRQIVQSVSKPEVRISQYNIIRLRRHIFKDMVEFERFCNSLPIGKRIFVHTPTEEKAPEGEGLSIYLGVEP